MPLPRPPRRPCALLLLSLCSLSLCSLFAPAALAQEAAPAPAEPAQAEPVQAEPVQAEPVINLRGRVLERGTRAPLVGVVVVAYTGAAEAPEQAFEAVTDEEGRFGFYELSPGAWSVVMEEAGYLLYRTDEEVQAGHLTEVTYYLEAEPGQGLDVLVEGQRQRKEVTRHKLDAQGAQKQPGSLGDPLAAVQNLPGVARSGFASGEIFARGSGSEDTRILVEGFDIPLIYHFGGLRSLIAAPMIKSLAFSPGNYSAAYGRALGGVLEVEIADLKPDALHGYADINVFDAGAYVEAPLTEELSIALAGRRSYIDAVLNDLLGEDAGLSFTVAPRYYDAQALVSWRPHRDHKLRLFALLSDDEIGFSLDNIKEGEIRATSSDFNIHIKTQQVALYYDAFLGDAWTNQARVGVANFSQEQEAAGLITDVTLLEPFLVDTLTWSPSPRLSLRLGGDIRSSTGTASGVLGDLPVEGEPQEDAPFDNQRRLDLTETYLSGGAFVEATIEALEGLWLTPGLRADVQPWTESLTGDLRLSARYQPVDALALKAGWGTFHQGPQVAEALEGLGNPDLDPESAVHYTSGVEWRPWETGLLDITGFYKDLDDLVVPTADTVVREGQVQPLYYDNSGRGRAYGVELQLRQQLSHGFSGWLSYTLSRSERWDAQGERWRLFDKDQTHVLVAVASYKLPWNVDLGLRWRLTSGNPETPVEGSLYDADLDKWKPLYGPINSQRLEAFHQLDLRLDKLWVFDTWRLNTYLDLQNAYNRANPEGYSWNHDYSQRAVISGLPLIPSLGLRGEF